MSAMDNLDDEIHDLRVKNESLLAENETLHAAIDWLTQHNGYNLISDDAGHWAISTSGHQEVASDPPGDMDIVSLVLASEWRATILEAIDAAQAGETT